jgi:hypothetical protein
MLAPKTPLRFTKKLNWFGFGHVELFIALLVVIAIGGIGTYLMVGSHAATVPDYKVRFIAVIPKGDTVPAWATNGTVKANALAIQNWYTKRVGKSFSIATADPQNFQMVRGTKTKSEYKSCPSAGACGGQASAAIVLNMAAEFNKPGYSTVIFTSYTPPIDGSYSRSQGSYTYNASTGVSTENVRDPYGTVKNYGVVAVQFAGSAGNYIGDAKSRRYAAHELGHNMGLTHTCNHTLMTASMGSCPVATSWPDTLLESTQATRLRTYSPFFNDIAP